MRTPADLDVRDVVTSPTRILPPARLTVAARPSNPPASEALIGLPSPVAESPLRRRFQGVFRTMALAAVLSYGSYLVLFAILRVPLMPAVNVVATLLSGMALWLVSRGHLRVATLAMAVVVLGHTVPATLVLGWSANFHLFAFLFLVFALLSPELNRSTKVVILAAVTIGYVALQAQLHDHPARVPPLTVTLFKILNTVMFSGTVACLALLYSSAIGTATQSLSSLNAQLSQLATTDSLTGLLNRRSMNEAIHHELVRFERTGRPFAVILGDVDDFKSVNDRHGHNAGDAVLTAIAQTLRATVRPMDHVGRWGGEEFLILLPEADAAGASAVARRVQHALTTLTVPTVNLRIKMTFGVASARAAQTFDELIAGADSALYQGKRRGKNRVTTVA
jgi:diguanylate cyclase (GGDEF)-like protein